MAHRKPAGHPGTALVPIAVSSISFAITHTLPAVQSEILARLGSRLLVK